MHRKSQREGIMTTDQTDLASLSGTIDTTLERLLAPIANIEKLKRCEYLTPEEVELVYGLKASTLANKRSRARGPEYIKDGGKILYKQQALKAYMDSRTVRTRA